MNEKQKEEWIAAQKISIGEDLIAVAQKQLQFLAAVDRQRWLYSSPGVERAIYRYKTCWLPLLAKYTEDKDLKDHLVVPIDCEWIWHCHRLNPVQYKMDCEKIYGRILDNKNVESSVHAESKDQSREIWTKFYPDEPFELDYTKISSEHMVDVNAGAAGTITYDLVAAVQRQSSFYYQVSRLSTHDPCFLAEALARYKGFLYLIKSNQVKSLEWATVPTYDIDLMWHSHQLCPVSYCKDLTALLGEVLQHDDTDPDRSVGKKLHNGFNETTEQFEETFGLRYWKAGAMYRGPVPIALTTVPVAFYSSVNGDAPLKSFDGFLCLPPLRTVEVFLEVVDVKDTEIHESETLYVSFTKKQHDIYFIGDFNLSIQSQTGKKDVACFQCEPMGDLILTLIAKSDGSLERVLGTCSISLMEFTAPKSKFSTEKWFQLNQSSSKSNSVPIYLRVAISTTLPMPASLTMNMVRLDKSFLPSLSFPLHVDDDNANYWTSFVDVFDNPIMWVQIRNIIPKDNMVPEKEVVAVTKLSRMPLVLAVGRGNQWSFKEASNFSGMAEIKTNEDGAYHCEINGDRLIKLYWGKKLEYKEKCSKSHTDDCDSITAVEFSNKNPYGKAIAALEMNSKLSMVNEEWFILPWAVFSLVFMDMKESNNTISGDIGNKSASCTVNGDIESKSAVCFTTCVWQHIPNGTCNSKLWGKDNDPYSTNGDLGGNCKSKLWSKDPSSTNGDLGDTCNSKLWGKDPYSSNGDLGGNCKSKLWSKDSFSINGDLVSTCNSKLWGKDPYSTNGSLGGTCNNKLVGKGSYCSEACIDGLAAADKMSAVGFSNCTMKGGAYCSAACTGGCFK